VNENCQVLYRYLYFQLLNSLKEFKNQSVGANTRFLKIGMIYNLQIPLPSIKEQNEIINILDKILSKTQQLETIYQQKLTKLEELKKSILQKAFNGELN
jgi:type I restriction enzyme S subunit